MPNSKSLKKENFSLQNAYSSLSYRSLLLGVITVLLLLVLVFFGIRFISNKAKKEISKEGATTSKEAESEKEVSSYTVIEGDTLWSISEKFYGTGFNYKDIVKENNISDPSNIFSGTVLSIPNIEPKKTVVTSINAEPVAEKIEGNEYTVVKDDSLWNIAVRSYGDGFRWVDIANVNNLANPGLIHIGNVFTIPR